MPFVGWDSSNLVVLTDENGRPCWGCCEDTDSYCSRCIYGSPETVYLWMGYFQDVACRYICHDSGTGVDWYMETQGFAAWLWDQLFILHQDGSSSCGWTTGMINIYDDFSQGKFNLILGTDYPPRADGQYCENRQYEDLVIGHVDIHIGRSAPGPSYDPVVSVIVNFYVYENFSEYEASNVMFKAYFSFAYKVKKINDAVGDCLCPMLDDTYSGGYVGTACVHYNNNIRFLDTHDISFMLYGTDQCITGKDIPSELLP